MHICDLIKNQDTYRADVNQTVLEVAQSMVARNIGAVPVLRDGVLAGIFSERDLMKRVVVEGRDPRKTRIGDVKGLVSLRDLLLHDLDEKDDEVRMMRAYIQISPGT